MTTPLPARYIDARPGIPVSTLTASAATWRGNSMAPRRSFPVLMGQTFIGRGNGRFGLVDHLGPRLNAARGTLDCWFKMGSGAHTVVIAQSVYPATTTPLISLGVDASGQAVGSIQDASGVTVAAWAGASMGGNLPGALVHMQVAWDTSPGMVHVRLNDVNMLDTDFTTAALPSWVPFQPLYLATGTFAGTGFDGEMILTQGALGVVI